MAGSPHSCLKWKGFWPLNVSLDSSVTALYAQIRQNALHLSLECQKHPLLKAIALEEESRLVQRYHRPVPKGKIKKTKTIGSRKKT